MFKCASFFAGVGGIGNGFESTDAFTQWHLEMNLIMINSGGHYQSGVVPTLTANQGEGGHNVCLVKTKFGIRKMTPRECFNAQGFPIEFKLPEDMSDARLYKQAGNSVCVSVIKRIADEMAKYLLRP